MRWPLAQYERSMAVLPVSAESVRQLITARAAEDNLTREQFARRFDGALRDRQKATLVVLVPLFATIVGLVTWRLRRPAVQHLVFAIHFYAFYLLWFGFGVRGLIWGLFFLLRPLGGDAVRFVSGLGSEGG